MLKNEHLSFYVSFKGRATRRDFNLRFAIVYVIGVLIAMMIDLLAAGGDPLAAAQSGMFSMFWNLLMLIPLAAVSCRRLHDMNMSGMWQVVPLAALIWLNWVMATASIDLAALNIDPTTGAVELPAEILLPKLAGTVVVLVFYLYLGLKGGTIGANKYGDDPIRRVK